MAKITHGQYEKLTEAGRQPISLPYEIFFNGNETLQKSPGSHHLEEFRRTGTYNHPNLRAYRERLAKDMAKRLLNGKMSAVSLASVGGMSGLKKRLAEFGMEIDEEQMEIIDMNAKFLSDEYEARKETSKEEREQSGREEVVAEPELGNKEKSLVRGATEAATSQLAPENDLSSGSENDKEKKVRDMTMPQLQAELKAKGIKQEFGQSKEAKQELLLKNMDI